MLVTLLGGCTGVVIGKPAPDPAALAKAEEERLPLNGATAFGELTTIDYCTLLDASKLKDVTEGPRVSLDNCYVRVQLDGQNADLWLGGVLDAQSRIEYASTTEIPDGPELKRRLTIEKPTSDYDGSCYRYLVFDDELSLQANISSYDTVDVSAPEISSERLCPVIEDVLEHAATAVVEKRVGHLDFPAGSLGSVDACGIVSDTEIGAHLGTVEPARKTLTKHSCRWGRSGSNYVSLYFSVDKPTPADAGYVPETLGGRQAMVWVGSGTYCSALTTLKPWPGAKDGEAETVSIFVSMYSGGDPCGVMRNVANTVFPRLPA
ncbi:hypothetical protein [Amycolatopsis sp. 195334CR]|uniref:hypothetical protein n=1 Tax=Amycolatopsis sp. 195334CR TaxID=2814588 RepID=UPI001A90A18C|nr:hypothetical protein [Amycolatopsis sp. 195334CR]MBN6034307.1 hypothetical protein [Amycolatopsis sp. 195334CR]